MTQFWRRFRLGLTTERDILRLAAVVLFAVLCVIAISGCSVPPRTVSVKVLPPAEFMQDCKVGAPFNVSTIDGLHATTVALARTLKLCNEDKKKLREWATVP